MNRNLILSGRLFLLLFVSLGFIISGCNRAPKSEGSGDFEASDGLDAETQVGMPRLSFSLCSDGDLERVPMVCNWTQLTRAASA